jgi:hypothetical protein
MLKSKASILRFTFNRYLARARDDRSNNRDFKNRGFPQKTWSPTVSIKKVGKNKWVRIRDVIAYNNDWASCRNVLTTAPISLGKEIEQWYEDY